MTTPATDRIALVVGASGAIGQAVLAGFLVRGWDVVATYRTGAPTPLPRVQWIRFDGSAPNDGEHVTNELAAISGTLSAVVCTIGTPSSKKAVAETPPSEYGEVFEGNVTAVVRLWHAIHRRAREASAGVVLLSSDTTSTLRPGNGAYSAAKAGLEALAATMAVEEAAYGVRFNVVAPSLVDSPLAEQVLSLKGVTKPDEYYLGLPWGRALTPHEVAEVAIDVAAGTQWQYVSGQTIRLAARTES